MPFVDSEGSRKLSTGTKALLSLLSALDLGWLFYTVLTPREVFDQSLLWVGALSLVPGNSPALYGVAFGVAGFLLLLVRAVEHPVLTWVGRAGLLVGACAWGTLGGSYGYVAATLGGLGTGVTMLAAGMAVLHLGVLILTTRR